MVIKSTMKVMGRAVKVITRTFRGLIDWAIIVDQTNPQVDEWITSELKPIIVISRSYPEASYNWGHAGMPGLVMGTLQ